MDLYILQHPPQIQGVAWQKLEFEITWRSTKKQTSLLNRQPANKQLSEKKRINTKETIIKHFGSPNNATDLAAHQHQMLENNEAWISLEPTMALRIYRTHGSPKEEWTSISPYNHNIFNNKYLITTETTRTTEIQQPRWNQMPNS